MSSSATSYTEIESASTGRDMRYAISNAFRKLYDEGRDADYINDTSEKLTAADFGKRSDVPERLPSELYRVDTKPKKGSPNLVASGSIIDTVGDIDDIEF